MPGKLAEQVSIAATTSGVTGTITVSEGAHLREITVAEVGEGQMSEIELSWTSSPSPLKFVPNVTKQLTATSGAGTSQHQKIPLDVVVKNATVVTIKITSTANLTCLTGLRWD